MSFKKAAYYVLDEEGSRSPASLCGGLDSLQKIGSGIVSYFIFSRCLLVASLVAGGLSAAQLYFNLVG